MAEKRTIIATARFADYESYLAFWQSKDLAWHQETGRHLLTKLREQSGEAAKLLDGWIYKRSCFFPIMMIPTIPGAALRSTDSWRT